MEDGPDDDSVMWPSLAMRFCEEIATGESPEEFLEGFARAPVLAGHLYAILLFDMEVSNGGIYQFFSNCTGVLGPEALAGYRATGLTACAEVVRAAFEILGEPYPRGYEERGKRLATVERPGEKRREWDPFFELTEEYYSAKSRDDFHDVLERYAQASGLMDR